jgi:hypothetical protein
MGPREFHSLANSKLLARLLATNNNKPSAYPFRLQTRPTSRHYLSDYISPSTFGSRARPTVIRGSQMPESIPFEYFVLATKIRRKRKIFSTLGRYVGICPEWAQPGDLLCMLYCGDVPYVLRPKGEGEVQLVGECYVHGMMNGQGLNLLKEGAKRKQHFVLI